VVRSTGFDHVIVHASRAAAGGVFRGGVGGQADDQDGPLRAGQAPDRLGRRHPIHPGHAHVHQHQVEAALLHGGIDAAIAEEECETLGQQRAKPPGKSPMRNWLFSDP